MGKIIKQIQHAWCSRLEVAKDDYIFIYEDEGGNRADLLFVLGGFLVRFLRLVEMSIHQTLIKRPEIVSVFCLTGFICCKLLPTSIDSQSQRAWGITVTCRSYR